MQHQEDMRNAEKAGSTTRKPEKTFEEMLYAIRDSLTDLESSNDAEDEEDETDDEEDIKQGNLSDDDEPGWVMGAFTTIVQKCMQRFRQKPMRLDKLTQPGWGDATDYFRERYMKYGMAILRVPAVVNPQPDTTGVAPLLTTCGELLKTLDIVPRQSQMQQGTSRPGSSQMWLVSEKPQSYQCIASIAPTIAPDLSPNRNIKSVKPVSFYQCISCA